MTPSKRIGFLVLVAIVTFGLVYFYYNPEVIDKIWLYVLGLIGTIIKGGQLTIDYIKKFFEGPEEEKESNATNAVANPTAKADLSLKILRYEHDEDTTLGLFYIEDEYYCYTLEDAPQEEKIAGKTRIPSGTYHLLFRKVDSPLTEKYRTNNPDWFTYHIELQNVENFQYVYIHNGGDHTHTDGCILVSDSLNVGKEQAFFTNSRNTFKHLYQHISQFLDQNKSVVLTIYDEQWTQKIK